MIRNLCIFLCVSLFSVEASAQDTTGVVKQSEEVTMNVQDSLPYSVQPVYKLKPAVDLPITLTGMGWSLYAFTKIYSKPSSSEEKILSLNKNDLNGFDRWATRYHSDEAAAVSDLLFYGSMPFPLILMLDKKMRKDAGKIGLLYLEAMASTGLLYTGSTYLTNRYRPYAYNSNTPMGDRTAGGAKNSFFAGHVALVGTSAFFMAKVYSDYHPESDVKWLMYSLAATATASTAYLRLKGGRHFPSDILLGATVGTLSGILVPSLHKTKFFKNENLSLTPFVGTSSGLSLTYKLNNPVKLQIK